MTGTNATRFVGIDLGGTKIAAALFDRELHIAKKVTRPTEAALGRKRVVANIIAAIEELGLDNVTAIGIGVPGVISRDGRISYMPHIPSLEGCDLAMLLRKRTGKSIATENDAKCFVLAEHELGAAKGKRDVVGVVLGTGVGCGLIINGQLYRGASGGAGEAGHTILKTGQSQRQVEELISGSALLRRYEALTGARLELARIDRRKDKAYRTVYDDFVANLGIFTANLINTLNPEMIVFGGGVSEVDFLRDLRKHVKKNALSVNFNACALKKNTLGPDAGIHGAAILARRVD